MGQVLSKRGAENAEDVLGAFFGEAYLHREIKCSSGEEQGHGQSCQEKMGEEIWEAAGQEERAESTEL